MSHLPSNIAQAVEDPKCAPEASLLSALNFYSEDIEDEALQLVTEELVRRGGDPDYLGTMSLTESYL